MAVSFRLRFGDELVDGDGDNLWASGSGCALHVDELHPCNHQIWESNPHSRRRKPRHAVGQNTLRPAAGSATGRETAGPGAERDGPSVLRARG